MNNQEDEETKAYRHIQIEQGKLKKGYACDICGSFATERHELIFRSQTLNNEEARRLSFQKELMAQLCSRCHAIAHTHGFTQRLLQRNIDIYGYESVEQALDAVKAVMKSTIVLIMPKRPEETNG